MTNRDDIRCLGIRFLTFLFAFPLLLVGLTRSQEFEAFPVDFSSAENTIIDLLRLFYAFIYGDWYLRIEGEHLVKPGGNRVRWFLYLNATRRFWIDSTSFS